MKLKPIRHWGITLQLTLLAAAPTVLIAIILTSYHLSARSNAQQENLREYGLAVTRNAAIIAELGLISADQAALTAAANSIASQSDVYGVRFLDKQRAELLSFPPKVNSLELRQPNNVSEVFSEKLNGNLVLFDLAVRPSQIDYSDHEESFTGDSEGLPVDPLLGWVQVIIDGSAAANELSTQRYNAIFMALAGLLAAVMASRYAASRYARKAKQIRDVALRISEGDLSARHINPSKDEIGELQTGLNRMADMVEDSQLLLREKIIQATEQLQDTLQELEVRNQDLEDATQLAESASYAKDEFLARMSHELRTPLTSISGFVNLLNKSKLNEEQSEYLNIVSQASQLLLATVNDILDLSELQQSNISLNPVEFELVPALDNMIAMHESTAFEKGIELIVDVEQVVPRIVRTDSMRFMQVCNNLMSNAVKFTEKGYVLVTVSLNQINETNQVLDLMVKDSGPGIDAEHLKNLFEPFYQGDTSIKRRYGGTGLGLMIAKGVAEKMGGEIAIDSTPGNGTEVVFTVPVEPVADDWRPARTFDNRAFVILDANPWSRRAIRTRVLNYSSQVFVSSNTENLHAQLSRWAGKPPCVLLSFSPDRSNSEAVADELDALAAHFSGDVVLLIRSSHLFSANALPMQDHFNSIQQLRKPLRNEYFYAAIAKVAGETSIAGNQRVDSVDEVDPIAAVKNKRVLIVEDNSYNRKLLETILKSFQINVSTTTNGKLGIEALQSDHFDLALVDLHMPEMDGIAVARLANGDAVKCPIILMTADLFAERGKIIGEFGIVDVLHKPLDEVRFKQSLLNFLADDAGTPSIESFSSQLLQVDSELLNQEINRLTEEIRAALMPFQHETVRKLTHELKGLTGLSAQPDIAETCSRIDAAAGEKNGAAIADLLEQL